MSGWWFRRSAGSTIRWRKSMASGKPPNRNHLKISPASRFHPGSDARRRSISSSGRASGFPVRSPQQPNFFWAMGAPSNVTFTLQRVEAAGTRNPLLNRLSALRVALALATMRSGDPLAKNVRRTLLPGTGGSMRPEMIARFPRTLALRFSTKNPLPPPPPGPQACSVGGTPFGRGDGVASTARSAALLLVSSAGSRAVVQPRAIVRSMDWPEGMTGAGGPVSASCVWLPHATQSMSWSGLGYGPDVPGSTKHAFPPPAGTGAERVASELSPEPDGA